MKLKRLGPPIYIGIDASSKLLPIVAFVSGRETPIAKLYKLADRAGASACGAGQRAARQFISELPWTDISLRLNLIVVIEQQVVYSGGRGRAVFLQALTSGAIQGEFANHGARITTVPPSKWKKAVIGHGGADKRRIASTVRQRWPDHFQLVGGSQDLIDAYCIARYACSTQRR